MNGALLMNNVERYASEGREAELKGTRLEISMPHGNKKRLMHVHFYSYNYRAVANFFIVHMYGT